MTSEAQQNARNFALLYWVMLISWTGQSAMMSLFPAIGRESGIPDYLIVATQSVSAFLTMLVAPYWAERSDREGRKPIILIGAAGFAIASMLTGLAILAGIHHVLPPLMAFAAILASRTVFGLFGLAGPPAVQAYVADRTTPAQRTSALAQLASANGIGGIIGPGLAPFLLLPVVTLAGPLFVFGTLGFLTLALAWFALPRDTPTAAPSRRPAAKGAWRTPELFPFVAFTFALSACNMASLQTLGFVVIDVLRLEPIAAQPFAGGAMMAGAAAALSVQLIVVRALKFTPPNAMLWGAGIALIGNAQMLFATTYPAIVIAFTTANFGYALARPGASAGASLTVGADRQGAAAGAIMSAGAAGMVVAPIVAMSIYQVSHVAPFVVTTLLCAGMAVAARMNARIKGALPA